MLKHDVNKSVLTIPILVRLALAGLMFVGLTACAEQNDSEGVAEYELSKTEKSAERPNFLIIMADDLGFSDIGAYGGEIDTPNIDALATSGIKMVNFYASLTCSPSRAMLMSGADNHLVGLGNMDETLADNQIGLPGYEGYLNERVVSLAEALKSGGYSTYMAGKWHLGNNQEHGPAHRGFDDSFALILGGASHYDNSFGPDIHRQKALYRDNGKLIDRAPEGFFSSDYYTTRLIESIANGKDNESPFFAYLSFTAPHWPLQFPPDYDGKYAQTYAVGWKVIQEQRLAKLSESGLMPDVLISAPLTADWDSLSEKEKQLSAKKMEVYAAMIDNMDANIGRLVDYLKDQGLYDNTVIVFLSDNGASSWANETAPPAIRDWASNFNNDYENIGQPDSFIFYGKQWAEVSNTPFKYAKGNASEGGMRVPMIVRVPSSTQTTLTSSEVLVGIEDIMPTFLDLAGIDITAINLKEGQVPITGTSFLESLAAGRASQQQASLDAKAFGRELWGKRGLRAGDWKIFNQPPPYGNGEWQLYNLENDLAEQIDLAATEPKKLAEMLVLWQEYVDRNNVVLPEGKFRVRDPGPMPTE